MLKDNLGNNGDSATLGNTVIGHQVEMNHQSISEHRLGVAIGVFVVSWQVRADPALSLRAPKDLFLFPPLVGGDGPS